MKTRSILRISKITIGATQGLLSRVIFSLCLQKNEIVGSEYEEMKRQGKFINKKATSMFPEGISTHGVS